MSKFKVGDKVRVLDGDTISCGIYWNDDMNKYIGVVRKIKDIRDSEKRTYTLENCKMSDIHDARYWVFAEEWLELVEENNMKTKLVKVGTATTQEECFGALYNGKVLHYCENSVKIIDGFVRNIDGSRCVSYSFDGSITWDILEEQETKWYDNIPEGGILCWVTGRKQPDRYYIDSITRWDRSNRRYYSVTNVPWASATPLTKVEIQDFMDRL